MTHRDVSFWNYTLPVFWNEAKPLQNIHLQIDAEMLIFFMHSFVPAIDTFLKIVSAIPFFDDFVSGIFAFLRKMHFQVFSAIQPINGFDCFLNTLPIRNIWQVISFDYLHICSPNTNIKPLNLFGKPYPKPFTYTPK